MQPLELHANIFSQVGVTYFEIILLAALENFLLTNKFYSDYI